MPNQDPADGVGADASPRALVEELLEGSPAGACLLDHEFRIVWLNAALAEMLGLQREQLVDGAGEDLVRAHMARSMEGGERVARTLLEQYREGQPADEECHLLPTNGRAEHWLARHSRFIGDGTERGRWVEFYVDVTDRKRAEAAVERLAASSEEQAFILGNMHGFTYRHDLDGVFHYMSPSVQRITGYAVEQWMNHYTTYLTDNPVNDEVVAKTEKALATGETAEPYLVEVFHNDGSKVLLEVAERVYFELGKVAGIVGVALDVTERARAEKERRSLEAQLQHTQKLESLGVLAGGIAHDFNNLLMVVLGNAGLALDEVSADSNAQEYLGEIITASQRAADLCRQMLAYSGRGAFSVRPLDLSETVSEIAAMLEVSISKKVRLTCEFAAELPAVEADAMQVQQVALNLITNASESIGDAAGEIHVRTGAGEFDAPTLKGFVTGPNPAPGTYVWIEVQDTGAGMSGATIERIFDPFFSTKFAGRGLGLSTVLGILRGHNGALEIESTLGGGTCIRVLFPVGVAAPAPPEQPPPRRAQGQGTVLLVDDEPAVLTVARAMLEKLGYQVVVAPEGRAGVEAFRRHRAQIVAVVLDVTMPEMGGDECLLEIRDLDPGMPVILASGYDEAEATRKLDRSISYGFLCKPFTLEALAEELRAVLGCQA